MTEPGTRSQPASSVTVTDGWVAPGTTTAATRVDSRAASEPKPRDGEGVGAPAPLAIVSSVVWLTPSPTPTAKTSALAWRLAAAAAVGSPPLAFPSVMTMTSWLRGRVVRTQDRARLVETAGDAGRSTRTEGCGDRGLDVRTGWSTAAMTVSEPLEKPTTPTRPPLVKRPSAATAVTMLPPMSGESRRRPGDTSPGVSRSAAASIARWSCTPRSIDGVDGICVRPTGEGVVTGTGVLVLSGSSGRVETERATVLAGVGATALTYRWFGCAGPAARHLGATARELRLGGGSPCLPM